MTDCYYPASFSFLFHLPYGEIAISVVSDQESKPRRAVYGIPVFRTVSIPEPSVTGGKRRFLSERLGLALLDVC